MNKYAALTLGLLMAAGTTVYAAQSELEADAATGGSNVELNAEAATDADTDATSETGAIPSTDTQAEAGTTANADEANDEGWLNKAGDTAVDMGNKALDASGDAAAAVGDAVTGTLGLESEEAGEASVDANAEADTQ